VSIITDSRYVHDRLARLLKGERPKGAHEDLWNRIASILDRVSGVGWVKAHLSQGEATRMGIPEGHWRLNQLADLAASEGITMHQEDPSYWALHAFRGRAIRGWQLHLLGIYRNLRQRKVCSEPAGPGLALRIRPQGPVAQPRALRTECGVMRKHHVVHDAQGSACLKCGRTTRAARQGQLQQWRRQCQPIHIHRARLERGHTMQWAGKWSCQFCKSPREVLSKRVCVTKTRKNVPAQKKGWGRAATGGSPPGGGRQGCSHPRPGTG